MGDEAAFTQTGAKKKKDDKHRRRDPRSWDNVKKTTLAMTEEERDEFLSKMYNDMYSENRTLYVSLQTREKQVTVMQKDNDRDRSELTKSILARGQLESLCRELQKQNKLIKEENVARIKEEEDRRREVANTFTERLNALTNLITESKDKSNKVKEENQNMTEKLTELYEQYQQRENHLETVTKQLDLQKKLAETQAKKTEIENEAERQTHVAEKKALIMQLEQYEREIVLLQEKNRSLEAQVDLYKSQYSDFETTMTKSNKVFDTFKEEMSRMNKQLHALETERNDLRKRWQSSVNSLIVLSEQHVALSNEQSALEKRLAMLQKLCRQLQEDRSAFLKQLKENNIEPIVPSVKNNENCENDASQQNLETTKSTQRAVKLKQELGKVKEVAALIKLGRDPPVDEDTDFSQELAQDFHVIQNQIEETDSSIDQYDVKTDNSVSKEGEGDSPLAGTSTLFAARKTREGQEDMSDDEAVTVKENIQEAGSHAAPGTSVKVSRPVHRAPGSTNLLMPQRVASDLSLSDSFSSIDSLTQDFGRTDSDTTLDDVTSQDNLQALESADSLEVSPGHAGLEEGSTSSSDRQFRAIAPIDRDDGAHDRNTRSGEAH